MDALHAELQIFEWYNQLLIHVNAKQNIATNQEQQYVHVYQGSEFLMLKNVMLHVPLVQILQQMDVHHVQLVIIEN